MKLKNDGDIILAIGYVTLYGAYVEDEIAELLKIIEKFIELKKNIYNLHISDQVAILKKYLIKHLKQLQITLRKMLNKK